MTAAVLTQPVFAIPTHSDHQIVMTENSSTSLTVTYDGSTTGITVINGAADLWTVFFPTTVQFNPAEIAWLEPQSHRANRVDFPLIGHFLPVFSDSSNIALSTVVHNGATVDDLGVDLGDHKPISVTFRDNGDTATLPDTGTTASLLGFSVFALVFLRRKRC